MTHDDMALKDEIFTRFDRYARVYTTSDATSKTVPSTPGQLDLSSLLAAELTALGIDGVVLEDTGYVYSRLPASPGCESVPAVGFVAHVDTSPQVSGRGVRPQRHAPWDGGEIVIGGKPEVILSPTTCPDLAGHEGQEIVTASGDTLLGADNKAGIAILMTLLTRLLASDRPHGPVCVAFSVDEEIGRGMDHFDTARFGARYAYTIDGDVLGGVEYECFNADSMTIDILGRSIHPAIAKNQLANAAQIAAEIIAAWPGHLRPEHTAGREGFLMVSELEATIETAQIHGIVRDHDIAKIREYEALMEAIVAAARLRHPKAVINLKFQQQYRNMRDVIDQHPVVMDTLRRAFARAELPLHTKAIRGGTDGSRLSFMGVPTPNIFTGGCNFHARDEWVSLDSMAHCVGLLEHLLDEWTQESDAGDDV